VFAHLLDNAAKFRVPGAAAHVSVASAAGEPGRATIVVRDDGVGIDPRRQERLFEALEKGSPGSEGNGIGLAVVRRIVESHGGRVWVESKGTGEGTAVFLTLPVPPPGARAAAATAGAARPRG
jgi:signal transduction histidine kinase